MPLSGSDFGREEAFYAQAVRIEAETHDAAFAHRANQRFVPKAFAGQDIGYVYFDHRRIDSRDGIADSD